MPSSYGSTEERSDDVEEGGAARRASAMPIELADFGLTDALKPHPLTEKRRKARYNAPGPGSYNVKEIEPSMTNRWLTLGSPA